MKTWKTNRILTGEMSQSAKICLPRWMRSNQKILPVQRRNAKIDLCNTSRARMSVPQSMNIYLLWNFMILGWWWNKGALSRGGHLHWQVDIMRVHGVSKSTLNTYFPVLKMHPLTSIGVWNATLNKYSLNPDAHAYWFVVCINVNVRRRTGTYHVRTLYCTGHGGLGLLLTWRDRYLIRKSDPKHVVLVQRVHPLF